VSPCPLAGRNKAPLGNQGHWPQTLVRVTQIDASCHLPLLLLLLLMLLLLLLPRLLWSCSYAVAVDF